MAIDKLLQALQVRASEHPLEFFVLLSVSLPLIYILANEVTRYKARVSGLSGPSGLPVIGNLWQIRKNAAEKYRNGRERMVRSTRSSWEIYQ